MQTNQFILPALPELSFSVTRLTLDAKSKLNHNEAHIHKECEIYINLSGDVIFEVENRIYPISRGSVIITRPYEFHHCIYQSNAPHDHYWITFSHTPGDNFLEPFFNREKGIGNLLVLDQQTLEQVCGILNLLMNKQADTLVRRTGYLQLLQVLRTANTAASIHNTKALSPVISSAIAFIKAHLGENITVKDIADAVYISVSTLERQFKKELNETPYYRLKIERLNASMRYLRHGSSVSEAAVKCGFPDYSNYIQLFRKQFGITPMQYKKKLQ